MSPNLTNITVLDQSPTFSYTPYLDGNSTTTGWRVFYSGSPDSSYDTTHKSENLASGTSLHSTSFVGASVTIEFMGTAIYLVGTGTAGAYSTSLDNGQTISGSPSNGNLVIYENLSYSPHTLSLNLIQAQPLNISSAILTVGIGSEGSTVTNTKINAVDVASDGSTAMNPKFSTSGSGPFFTAHGAASYSRLDTTGQGSVMSFKTSNASALFFYGTVNYDHGSFSVSLSPSAGASSKTRTLAPTSVWFAYDVLLYWETDLDTTTEYTVAFENLDGGKYFDIHQVVVMTSVGGTASGPSNSTQTGSGGPVSSSSAVLSTGAIIGIALGGAVVLAMAFVVLCLAKRNRKKRREAQYSIARPTAFTSPGPYLDANTYSQPLLTNYENPSSHGELPATAHKKMGQHQQHSTYSSNASSTLPGSSTNDLLMHERNTPYSDMSYPPTDRFSHATSDAGSFSPSTSGSKPTAPPGIPRPLPPPSPLKGGTPTPTTPSRIRQELDAGPVELPAEEVLPPGYNPAWSGGPSR